MPLTSPPKREEELISDAIQAITIGAVFRESWRNQQIFNRKEAEMTGKKRKWQEKFPLFFV